MPPHPVHGGQDAEQANARGGIAPAVLSAADEIAVERFAKGEIGYTDIPRIVEAAVSAAPSTSCDSLDAVFEADRWARSFAASFKSSGKSD